MWKHVLVLALFAGVAHATLPPDEKTYPLGRDSKGAEWSGMFTYDHHDVLASGSTSYKVASKRPLDHLAILLHAIDKRDRALLADTSGQLVVIDLAQKGATSSIDLPKSSNSITAPALAGDHVWYIDTAAYDKAARVMRHDLATGKTDVAFPGEGTCDLHDLAVAGDTVWVAGVLRKSGGPTHTLVLALDRTSFKVQARIAQPVSGSQWYRIPVVGPKTAWVHSYGTVHHVDTTGAIRTWPIAPGGIASLVGLGGRAAVLSTTGDEKDSPPGMQRVTSATVAVIDPASDEVRTLKLDGDLGHGRLEIVGSGPNRLAVHGRTIVIQDGKPVLEKK